MQYVVTTMTRNGDELFWTGDMTEEGGVVSPATTPLVLSAKRFMAARCAYQAAGESAKAERNIRKGMPALLDFTVRQVASYERRLEQDEAVARRVKLGKEELTALIEARAKELVKQQRRA